MYAKGKFFANYFKSDKEATEKTVFGNISEAIKVGEDASGKNIYEFDNWNAYFVGKAYEKAKGLKDGTNIVVTEWITRNIYKNKKIYPQIRILNFEVSPKKTENE